MATRNYEEYRAQALAELGEDYTVEDLRNEEKFRGRVLEGLGAEYTEEDTRNFERYRLKVLENLSGGGGGDLTVVNVTVTQIGEHYADLSGCCCYTEDDENYSVAFLDYEVVNKVILYKGSAMVNVNNRQGTITVSGNAVYNESSETIMVTGDCTITIS